MATKKQFTKNGFTLIELLVVISIISLLSSIVLTSLRVAKQKANNSSRLQAIKSFETGLDLYYAEHGKYPGWNNGSDVYPAGTYMGCYDSFWYGGGSCEINVWSDVVYDNSASTGNGLLQVLYDEGFINKEKWNDPSNPTISPNSKLKWNCRYAVRADERNVNNVQHYMLYCRVNGQSYVAQNDGGFNPNLFEIQKPELWLCVKDNANIDTYPDCN